jgi:hypothetical protein
LQQEVVVAVEELALMEKVPPQFNPDVEVSVQHKTIQPESGTPVDGF